MIASKVGQDAPCLGRFEDTVPTRALVYKTGSRAGPRPRQVDEEIINSSRTSTATRSERSILLMHTITGRGGLERLFQPRTVSAEAAPRTHRPTTYPVDHRKRALTSPPKSNGRRIDDIDAVAPQTIEVFFAVIVMAAFSFECERVHHSSQPPARWRERAGLA